MTDPAIAIHDLTCRFGKTVAVDHLTLEVAPGTIFGFLGENGAGKTTTIRTLMGLHRPASGEVRVLGENPLGGNAPLLQKIGFVSDKREMYRWMKVKDILRFNAGLYRNWDPAYANTLLKDFDLDLKKKVKQLSRGQLAKLSLLCAMAHHPKVLILDEASSGLDIVVRRALLEKLIEISSEDGATIFLSTHLLEEVERLADRIGILCQGRLLIEGDQETLRNSFKRVIAPKGNSDFSLNGADWILSARTKENEREIVVRDLDSERREDLKNRLGGTFKELEMSLEDVFAELSAWGKRQ